MKKYKIVYSEQSYIDMENLFNFIISEYKTYRTVMKYVDGIENENLKFRVSAESYPIQTRIYFQQYGVNVRRINYKR